MNGKTIRDYLVALAVTLVSGIPFLITEGLGIRIYFYFFGVCFCVYPINYLEWNW